MNNSINLLGNLSIYTEWKISKCYKLKGATTNATTKYRVNKYS